MAVKRIEALMGALPDTPEGDEMDVLVTLVEAYEAKHHAIDAPDPIAAIEFRMEQQHLSRRDLEPLIGSRARVSEVLGGRRPLTMQMVRRIKGGLGISADQLIASAPTLPGLQLSSRKPRVSRTSQATKSKKESKRAAPGRSR